MIEAIFGLGIFIGAVALILALIEKLAKKVGSKVIYISIIFVIPTTIGLAIVASNYQSLKWYEIVYYPFIGSALILAAILLILVQMSPEIICIPFQYLWKVFVKRRK